MAMDPDSRNLIEFFEFPPKIERRLVDADEQERAEVVLEAIRWVGMSQKQLCSTKIRLLCEIDRLDLKEGVPFLEFTLSWGKGGYWFREHSLAARVYLRLQTEDMTPEKRIDFLVGTFMPGYPYEVQGEALKMLEHEGPEARRRLYDLICLTDVSGYASVDAIRPLLAAGNVARSKVLAPTEAEFARMVASSSPVANVLAKQVLEERMAQLVRESRFEEATKIEPALATVALSLFESADVARLGLRGMAASGVSLESFPRLFEIIGRDGYDDEDVEMAESLLRGLCRAKRSSPQRVPEAVAKGVEPALKEIAALDVTVPEYGSPENCRLLWLRMRARKLALEALDLLGKGKGPQA
ncbi:MAG: hypothetical protein ACYTKD_25640 [Planctomycetota bacterium]|jgi:hypothetical protein